MFVKRSQMLENIESKLISFGLLLEKNTPNKIYSASILEMIEIFMEPKLRPLTNKEVEEHVLVKQAPEDLKDEVKTYVKSLDYEHKREYIPEDN